jgi:hypothetical protein
MPAVADDTVALRIIVGGVPELSACAAFLICPHVLTVAHGRATCLNQIDALHVQVVHIWGVYWLYVAAGRPFHNVRGDRRPQVLLIKGKQWLLRAGGLDSGHPELVVSKGLLSINK